MSIHRRQFIISKNKFSLDDFLVLELKNNFFISYQKDLKITKITTQNQSDIVYLIGHAYQTDSQRQSPILELQQVQQNDLKDCYVNWAGRWLLIYNDEIHMDATGNLGVFYSDENNLPLVSSSCSLLQSLYGIESTLNLEKISHTKGMDWYAGPLSVLNGVYRALPNQSLKLADNSISVNFNNLISNNFNNLTDDEKVDLIVNKLNTLIRNISKEYDGNIVLPLTAGYDSRTILSLLLANDVNFSTLSLQHDNITNADMTIPIELSKKYNFKHTFVKRQDNYNLNMLNEFDKHTLFNCVDSDRLFYAFNQFPHASNTLLLRGGIWEVAREFFYESLPEYHLTSFDDRISLLKDIFEIDGNSLREKSLVLWLQFIENNPIDMDWRDRLYLDQRVGCWLSSIEQGLDLTDYDRLHPVNCSVIISLLISLSKSYRENQNHQLKIIEKTCTDLLLFPFNKPTLSEKLKKSSKRAINLYRDKGLLYTFKKLVEKFS